MNAPPGVHPAEETLVAYGLGKADDTTAAVVALHLENCSVCRAHVAGLPADSFLSRLQMAKGSASTSLPSKFLSTDGHSVQAKQTRSRLPQELADCEQYEEIRELGKGGMGIVYLAKNKLMGRDEVLKVVNRSMLHRPEAVERFLREIQSAAKLQHPNVVAAYSAMQLGELLVFAMEYVPGQDLAQVVRNADRPLSFPNACYYAYQTALGLQHAHEKGMVHRDIKPSNLMLTNDGKKPLVKILDFGLAKVSSEKGFDPALTGAGKMLGTPDFMSPEQGLDAAKADIRADIYSLGCTLYYLLVGRPPFEANSLLELLQHHQGTEAQSVNLVRPDVPAELGDVIAQMMAKDQRKRYQTPAEVANVLTPFVKSGADEKLGPDVSLYMREMVVTTGIVSLQSEIEPKIFSAKQEVLPATSPPNQDALVSTQVGGAVRESLLETSETRPAQEARLVPVQRQAKQRSWLWPAMAGVVILILLLAAWTQGLLKVKTPDGILVVEVNEPNAEVYVDGNLVSVTWDNGGKKAEIHIRPGTRKVEVKKDGFTAYGEEVTLEDGKHRILVARLDKPPPPVGPGNDTKTPAKPSDQPTPIKPAAALEALRRDQIPVEAMAVAGDGEPNKAPACLVGVLGAVVPIHYKPMLGLAFSPDSSWLASSSEDKTIMLRDVLTGDVKRILKGHTEAVSGVAFSKDSKSLLTASFDGSLRLWSVDKDEKPLVVDTKLGPKVFQRMAVSYDGRFVVVGGESGLIKLWKWGEWDKPTEFSSLIDKVKIRALALSPDGELLACGGEREVNEKQLIARVRIYATADGSLKGTLTHPIGAVFALNFSHDGKHLASVGHEGNGRVWEVATGKEVSILSRDYLGGEWPNSFSVAWSPDDKMIAVGGHSQVVVYDSLTGNRQTIRWDITNRIGEGNIQYAVRATIFSSKGNLLAAGGHYGDVPVWDTTNWQRKYLERGHRHYVRSVATNLNGKELISLGDESAFLSWKFDRLQEPTVHHLDYGKDTPMQLFKSAAFFSQDGKTSVITWHTGIALRNTDTEKETVIPTGTGPLGLPHIGEPAISPDARTAAFAADGYLQLWDLTLGRAVHRFPTKGSWNSGLAFSQDGKLLASYNAEEKRETIWDVATGSERCSCEIKSRAMASAFHPNGMILATGHEDGSILVWDTTGKKLQTLTGHLTRISSLKFTPDGKTIISSSADGTLRLWNPDQPRAREIIPLGPANRPLTFDLDSSGRYLFAAGQTPLIFILRLP